MAAPAFRSASTTSRATQSTVTITKPSGTVADDILVATINAESAPTITPPSGFTSMGSGTLNAGNDSVKAEWFWKRAGGAEPASYDFTLSASVWSGGAMEAVSGTVASGDPNDATPVINVDDTDSTSAVCNSITTVTDECYLGGSVGLHDGTQTFTPPGGFTERFDNSCTIADKTLTPAGASGNATFTVTVGHVGYVSCMFALKPPVGQPLWKRFGGVAHSGMRSGHSQGGIW